jgi:hypothetical protein
VQEVSPIHRLIVGKLTITEEVDGLYIGNGCLFKKATELTMTTNRKLLLHYLHHKEIWTQFMKHFTHFVMNFMKIPYNEFKIGNLNTSEH